MKRNHARNFYKNAVVIAAAACVAQPAAAFFNDRLEVYLTETVARDTNVFRLSRERDPTRDVNDPTGGDTFLTTALGVRADVPYGQHRFFADYSQTDTNYRRLSQLDYRGYNAQGSWTWVVPDVWNSRVSFAQLRTLGSFADSRIAEPNIVRSRLAQAEASWVPGASWRLNGAIASSEQTNSRRDRVENDIEITAAEVGLAYVLRPGDAIGVGLRREEGRFPNRQFVAGSFFDNAYTQDTPYVFVEYRLASTTTLSARLGRLDRQYDQLGARDYEGTYYRVALDWKPTVKTGVVVIAQQDISAAEDLRTSFVLLRGVSIRPSWRPTEKITVTGAFDYGDREYLGDPRFVLPGLPPSAGPRSDKVRTATLGVAWAPYTFLTLAASASREERRSSFIYGDYKVSLYSLQGRLSF